MPSRVGGYVAARGWVPGTVVGFGSACRDEGARGGCSAWINVISNIKYANVIAASSWINPVAAAVYLPTPKMC